MSTTSIARADDIDAFSFALHAYVSDQHEAAESRFRALIENQAVQSPELVEAARRYRAASLLFINRERDARAVIEQLLRANPDARVDALLFTPQFVRLFDDVRSELDRTGDLAAIRESLRRARAEESERRARERRQLEQLERLLSQETVVHRVSRGLMMFPFGVGQFANGNTGLGALFLTTQGLGLAGAFATTLAFDQLFRWTRPLDMGPPGTEPAYVGLPIANVLCWSLFGISALAGVVQANVAYRAERIETRDRPPPVDVRRLRFTLLPVVNSGGLHLTLGAQF